MNEIYWITRLDAICGFLTISAAVSALIAVVAFFMALVNKSNADIFREGSTKWKHQIDNYNIFLYLSKRCIVAFVVLVFTNLFIPTTNEALLIYGVGGTVDYIKSNDTAKQLPDKYIKALDKYLDNLTKEENQKENDNESK